LDELDVPRTFIRTFLYAFLKLEVFPVDAQLVIPMNNTVAAAIKNKILLL
jgi:hypothetical protein